MALSFSLLWFSISQPPPFSLSLSTKAMPRLFRSSNSNSRLGWVVLMGIVLGWLFPCCHACTDILVTPGASKDSSAMIAYNADSANLYGTIYQYPATNVSINSNSTTTTMRSIYDWDTGVYLGDIAEVSETYQVVGNTNEHGLVIGESTFGGWDFLRQPNGTLDYGSLIYITLQRAQTCRQAIAVMTALLDEYGYYSSGESFSLMDSTTGQVWMMEVVGRGMTYGKRGAVWVAQRIPNGHVAAHANQARITTWDWEDSENCLYAPDVVDVAIHYGLYAADADPHDFDFAQAFDPMDFGSARHGEARVWSIFSHISDPASNFSQLYERHAMGLELTHRMPLSIQPYRLLSVHDVMKLLTSHYEGTLLDASRDVGSGLDASPYRPRPLIWDWNGTSYHNERSIAVPQTGWSFVAQIRPWMPPLLSGLIWFAADDSSTAPRVPIYSASTRIAHPYAGQGAQDGVRTPLLEFDWSKAFWVQNVVSNYCYSQWNKVYPIVRRKIDSLQVYHEQLIQQVDQKALLLYESQSPQAAADYVTQFSVQASNRLHSTWQALFGQLFVQFRDLYTIVTDPDEPVCGCQIVEHGMSREVKERIAVETGTHYQVPPSTTKVPTTKDDHPQPSHQPPGVVLQGEQHPSVKTTTLHQEQG